MKKKLLLISTALLLGAIMSFITLKNFNQEAVVAELYQLGVFKNFENAKTTAENFPGSIIVNKNNMYQVIGGIAESEPCKAKLETLLEENDVSYFKKPVNLTKEEEIIIKDYETVMKEAKDLDTLKVLNQKLLEELQERMSS